MAVALITAYFINILNYTIMKTKTTSKTKELNNCFTIMAILLVVLAVLCADSFNGSIEAENDNLNPINSTTQNY